MKQFIFVAVLLVATFNSVSASPRIEAGIDAELANLGEAGVVIIFEMPHSIAIADLSRRDERRQVVSERTDQILASLGAGFRLTHRFNLVSALAGRLDRHGLDTLRNLDGIVSVGLDQGGSGSLADAIPLLGIDDIQAAPPAGLGFDGTGIKVAVLDTGIDGSHPDFSGALQAEACFCANPNTGNCCPNGNATQVGTGAAADDHNHGTWVTGHIMGQGGVAPVGAAPGASLIAVKVLDANNSFWGSADITAAYDWLAVNHPDIGVVNASLGTNATFSTQCDGAQPWTQAMSQAVAALTANGALLVASTGNQAVTSGIQVPSCLGDVIAVGATWKDARTGSFFGCNDVDPAVDDVACFSNHSTELDILAPGVFMTTTQLGGGSSAEISGTSFASPLVAGCAALIRQAHPELSSAQVRQTMVQSNVHVVDDRVGLTYPRLDCRNAIMLELFRDRFQLVP